MLLLQAQHYLQPATADVGSQVYEFFRQAADWPQLLPPGQSFSVEARVAGRNDVNENFLRLRARDAICDAIRDRRLMPRDALRASNKQWHLSLPAVCVFRLDCFALIMLHSSWHWHAGRQSQLPLSEGRLQTCHSSFTCMETRSPCIET